MTSIPDSVAIEKALDDAHSLVDMGVPVFTCRLNSDGGPMRKGWEKITPDRTEVDRWRPGMALCARTGGKFDVLDVDPRNGGLDSFERLSAELGDDGPHVYRRVKTPSGGRHLWIRSLGQGTHHPIRPDLPGLDLQGEGALVFLPPTERKGGGYAIVSDRLAALNGSGPSEALIRALSAPTASLATSGRPEDPDELRAACVAAQPGEQRAALLRYVHELERTGYKPADILRLCASLDLPNFDKRRPWREADFRGLLHKPGEVIPDARPGELDGITPIRAGRREDAEYRRELARLRIQRRARAELDAEGWEPPGTGQTLTAARRNPPQPVHQTVQGVVPEGISIMAAQFKAGKTTLAINLADALGSGADFLGAYPVDFPAGRVGYWNLEVDEPQFYSWLDRCVKDSTAADRIVIQNLRGNPVNFLNKPHADWTVQWLLDNDIRAWVIDPLGRMLDEENSNSEFNRWIRELERIVRLAGVHTVFIPHHTGHGIAGQDGMPRARGASAMLGGTDVNLSYRHGGELGGYPPDDRRYLSGFGRGIDLREVTLDFDAATGRLFALSEAPGREADREDRLATKAVDALALSGEPRLNSTALQEAIGGNAAGRMKAINASVRAGLIVREKDGRIVWYSLPDDTPKARLR
jgi:hypothetical protein